MAFPIAGRNAPTSNDALTWAMIYVILLSVIPTLYIMLQVRRGNITDVHMPHREERIRPFIVSIISASIATVMLFQIGASAIMRLFVLSSLIQVVIMALITTSWQISIHTISVAGAVITAGTLFGTPIALVLLPLVLVVSRARLKLRRHTRAQVVAGIIVGAVSVSVLLALAGALEPDIWSRQ